MSLNFKTSSEKTLKFQIFKREGKVYRENHEHHHWRSKGEGGVMQKSCCGEVPSKPCSRQCLTPPLPCSFPRTTTSLTLG